MNYEHIDLFEETYLTLKDILDLVESINKTGGYFNNDFNKPIPMGYVIDYYKDLAFIVLYKDNDDETTNEKVIDCCVELQEIQENLYKIISIDGKCLGQFNDNSNENMQRLKLIQWFMNGELFRGDKNGN